MVNNPLDAIIAEADENFISVPVSFRNDSWSDSIPAQAGWYLIMTNTPLKEFESVHVPLHKSHIDIPQAIENSSTLYDIGIAVSQYKIEDYVVYNGEAANLRTRAREHVRGHAKTFCLGLSNYETLHRYNWRFCYVAASSCRSLKKAGKLLRLAVEQGWRSKHGWPVLCGR